MNEFETANDVCSDNAAAMLESLLANSLDLVFFKDQRSRFVRYSRSFALHLGLADPEALKGKTAAVYASPEEVQSATADEQRIIRTGEPLIGKLEQAVRSDGRKVWLLTTKMPWRNAAGDIIGTYGVSKDVTAMKNTEAELARASSLLNTMLENSPDYIYFKDLKSRFVTYSNSMARVFKLANPNDLKGKSDFDFYTEAYASAAFEDEQKIIRTGQPMIGKSEKETHPDGHVSWALTTKTPWRDAEGNIIGTFGISKDVTELKQAEAELAQASSLLGTLLENSPDCIYFKDRQSRFVLYSKSLAHLFRVADPKELKGKTDFDFYTDEHARPAFEDEQTIMRTGQPIVGKPEKETHPDGRITWALTTKMPWRDAHGNIIGTFGISKDVTGIKEAEDKVEQMHQQLLETSRHAGMAEVASSVLHNVGNVLNSVNVSVSLTTDKLQESKIAQLSKAVALMTERNGDLAAFISADPRGKQLPAYLGELAKVLMEERDGMLAEMKRLNKNIEHIKDIVAMQQNYAKVAGVTEKVKITDLMEDALRMHVGALMRHDIQMSRDYAPQLPEIVTEKHKVLQILVNLIHNAKYACDDSGKLDKQLRLQVSHDPDSVSVTVTDNGVGISKENLTRIFNHGFTTRKNGHGFGLHSGALAAKELGGSLTAHSEGPGTGATFTLRLPLHPPQAAA